MELTRLSIVSGNVVDENDQPITGVHVRVFRQEFYRGRRRWSANNAPASVDENGRFRIANLSAGRYLVAAMMEGAAEALPPSNTGRYGTTYYPSVTEPLDAEPITLLAGSEFPVSIRLRRRQSFTVSGRAELPSRFSPKPSENRPAGQLMNLQLTSKASEPGLAGGQFITSLFEDGAFEFQNVSPGEYTLQPSYTVLRVMTPGGNYTVKPSAFGRIVITISDRSIRDIVLPLRDGLTLNGTVSVDQPSESDASFLKNLKKVQIQLFGERPYGPTGLSAQPDGTGNFRINDIPFESYRYTLSGLPEGYYVKSALLGRTSLSGKVVDLSTGGETAGPLRIIVSPNGATAAGTVRDTKELAQEGVLVVAVLRADRDLENPDILNTRTDRMGQFEFKGLQPGEWDFFAFDDDEELHSFRGPLLRRFASKSKAVQVSAVSTTLRSPLSPRRNLK